MLALAAPGSWGVSWDFVPLSPAVQGMAGVTRGGAWSLRRMALCGGAGGQGGLLGTARPQEGAGVCGTAAPRKARNEEAKNPSQNDSSGKSFKSRSLRFPMCSSETFLKSNQRFNCLQLTASDGQVPVLWAREGAGEAGGARCRGWGLPRHPVVLCRRCGAGWPSSP